MKENKKLNKSTRYSVISTNPLFFIYHHLEIEKKKYLSDVCLKTLRYMTQVLDTLGQTANVVQLIFFGKHSGTFSFQNVWKTSHEILWNDT